MRRRSDKNWQKRLISQRLRLANQTLASISSSASQDSNQGFALPMALGMGLIMLLVGTTMILRSQDDQVTASAQKGTAQSLLIAEGGVNRSIAELNQSNSRPLLRATYDPDGLLGGAKNEWSGPVEGNNSPCPIPYVMSDVEIVPLNGTIGAGSSAGTYTLLAYRFDKNNNTGTLLLEGQNSNALQAKSRIKLTLPLSERILPERTLTTLVAENINLEKTDVDGSITCIDPELCPVRCSAGDTEPTEAQRRAAIRANKNAKISGTINFWSFDIPTVPKVPNGATVINLGSVSSNLSLPRDEDKPHVDGQPYYYTVNSINKASIEINTADPVYLYVSGNIDQTGNDDIKPSSSDYLAGNLRIYGADINGTPPSSQTFTFGGNSCTKALIHAPNAAVGIDGGGSGCKNKKDKIDPAAEGANIYGALWAKSFNVTTGNPSNSSIIIEQKELLSNLAKDGLVFMASQSNPASNWQRQEVP